MKNIAWTKNATARGRYVEDGFSALNAELGELSASVSAKKCGEALEKGCELVAEGVKNRIVPKGESTGTLRDSIVVGDSETGEMGTSYTRAVGWAQKKRPGGKTSAQSAHVYGPILEYSETRKLRHMKEGFDDTREAALEKMQSTLKL